MIDIRKSETRGRTLLPWLNGRHSFSFNRYYDPKRMGFRALRVINEDVVAPGGGFGEHGHRDMEIATVVLSGALEHGDSLGHRQKLVPGEVQRMSAGRGILHSELNASDSEPVHLLQIWLEPERAGLEPSYEQRPYPDADRRGKLRLLLSHDGRESSMRIAQDARLYDAELAAGEKVELELAPGRHAWVQVARGAVKVNGAELAQGDGAAVSEEAVVRIEGTEGTAEREPALVLVFDLA